MPPGQTEEPLDRLTGTPAILILAASERAPAYEAQMGVLEEQADELEERGVVIACLFLEGESRLGSERLDRAEAERLRQQFGAADEDFQILVLNASGDVVRNDDAPLQGDVVLNALD